MRLILETWRYQCLGTLTRRRWTHACLCLEKVYCDNADDVIKLISLTGTIFWVGDVFLNVIMWVSFVDPNTVSKWQCHNAILHIATHLKIGYRRWHLRIALTWLMIGYLVSSPVGWHNVFVHGYPLHWPFVRGIHRTPVDSPHKGHWRGASCFLWSTPEQRLSKQSWRRWFETPSRSLWGHCNYIYALR